MKLQEHKIISNKLVDDIDELFAYWEDFTHGKEGEEITRFRKELMKLIPAERLAEVCVDKGIELRTENIGLAWVKIEPNKKDFLNSEIVL
jgi:hypothetical protein